jgi:beta-ribofuranosylaminobenzene 5'-phosphate synthase
MIVVQAPSRLHFGLLSLRGERDLAEGPNQASFTNRCYGGVGLMIESPGISIRFKPSKEWSAQGPLAERVLRFTGRFLDSFPHAQRTAAHPAQEIMIERCAPEHAGLGTGTQLGLAVARGLAEAWQLSISPEDLCRRVGRGQRSAIGFHGFIHGGFLVEAGKTNDSRISPLVARVPFPEEWRIVLISPPGKTGLHGFEESEVFQQLTTQRAALHPSEALCRLTLLGLLPALSERNFKNFSESLFDFNRLAGQAFAPSQGGIYAGPHVEEMIHFIQRQGFVGAGQSSWGPTVFAVTEDESAAKDLAARICASFNLQEKDIWVTAASNQGAIVRDDG